MLSFRRIARGFNGAPCFEASVNRKRRCFFQLFDEEISRERRDIGCPRGGAGVADDDRVHLFFLYKIEYMLERFLIVQNCLAGKGNRAVLVRDGKADSLKPKINAEILHTSFDVL